jgi:hypothetical protein
MKHRDFVRRQSGIMEEGVVLLLLITVISGVTAMVK